MTVSLHMSIYVVSSVIVALFLFFCYFCPECFVLLPLPSGHFSVFLSDGFKFYLLRPFLESVLTLSPWSGFFLCITASNLCLPNVGPWLAAHLRPLYAYHLPPAVQADSRASWWAGERGDCLSGFGSGGDLKEPFPFTQPLHSEQAQTCHCEHQWAELGLPFMLACYVHTLLFVLCFSFLLCFGFCVLLWFMF